MFNSATSQHVCIFSAALSTGSQQQHPACGRYAASASIKPAVSELHQRSLFSSFQEWAYTLARRPSYVGLSVCPAVNICANRFLSHSNDRIATKLAHDGLQVSMHAGCAQGQGQGQRSRDTRTFLDSWNELHVLRHWRPGLRLLSFVKVVSCCWNYQLMQIGRFLLSAACEQARVNMWLLGTMHR